MRTLLGLLGLGVAVVGAAEVSETQLEGAWRPATTTALESVLLVQDGYWSYTEFDRERGTFGRTFGGPFRLEEGRAVGVYHFDSKAPERVGKPFALEVELESGVLVVRYDAEQSERWQRADDGDGPLSGVWRITGREQEGKVQPMPLRARRTLKILTGTRFQWIAMNIETGEFSGTGGGTYTFADGRYTETIEFFSRDATRVGARLAFSGAVEGRDWHHRGFSSRGDPIYEIWSPLEAPAP